MGVLLKTGPMPEKTDEEIARAVQAGRIQEFGILVERYEAKMMRYARRFLLGHDDAQDAVQEVFIKSFTNLKSFDSNRSFSSWLYRIAHNQYINIIKKKKREPLSFFDPDTLFPHPIANERSDRDINEKELHDALEKCLGEISVKYREPLILYYYEQMDYQEIAEIMHIPTSTVGIRLRRGKAMLQELYKKINPPL